MDRRLNSQVLYMLAGLVAFQGMGDRINSPAFSRRLTPAAGHASGYA
jgi:hypothetical protein